jgi:hypothetical protein
MNSHDIWPNSNDFRKIQRPKVDNNDNNKTLVLDAATSVLTPDSVGAETMGSSGTYTAPEIP